jgi:hypothetical protein
MWVCKNDGASNTKNKNWEHTRMLYYRVWSYFWDFGNTIPRCDVVTFGILWSSAGFMPVDCSEKNVNFSDIAMLIMLHA